MQFNAAGQQVHYVRIPQSAIQQQGNASNLTQVIQLQQQMQQQNSQQQTSESQNASAEERPAQETAYSQVIQTKENDCEGDIFKHSFRLQNLKLCSNISPSH